MAPVIQEAEVSDLPAGMQAQQNPMAAPALVQQQS